MMLSFAFHAYFASVNGVVEAAKAGDPAARVAYLRYLRPRPPRLNPTPLNIETPRTVEDLRAVASELATLVLAGLPTPTRPRSPRACSSRSKV
jgi:hypothetical protein